MLSTTNALASVPETVLEFILQTVFPIAVVITLPAIAIFLAYIYLNPDWRYPKLPPEPDHQDPNPVQDDDTSSREGHSKQ